MSERSDYPRIRPLPDVFFLPPTQEYRGSSEFDSSLFSTGSTGVEPSDRRLRPLLPIEPATVTEVQLDQFDFPDTTAASRIVYRVKKSFDPHLDRIQLFTSRDEDPKQLMRLQRPVIDIAFKALPNLIAHQEIERACALAKIEQEYLGWLVWRSIPEDGQHVKDGRADSLIPERERLLKQHWYLKGQHPVVAQRMMKAYQRHALQWALGGFIKDSQRKNWAETRDDLVNDALAFSRTVYKQYPLLQAAALMRTITAPPSEVLIGNE